MTSYLLYRARKWAIRSALISIIGLPLTQQALGLDFDWKQLASGASQILSVVTKDVENNAKTPPGQTSNSASFQHHRSGNVEVAFSPNRGAEDLIIKVLRSASREIDVMAYSFTSVPITNALIAAQKRGVKVRLIADEKHNLDDGSSRKARAALSALSNAGVQVYVTSQFAIHHDKAIMVDGLHLQTGSFNYSASANSRNSENVLVMWNSPEVVASYQAHFRHNLAGARLFVPAY